MKTTINTEIKGVKFEVTFEGSIKELLAVNTAMVRGTEEWIDLFNNRGHQIFDLIDAAVERSKQTSKKVILADKEVNDFDRIINPKKKD